MLRKSYLIWTEEIIKDPEGSVSSKTSFKENELNGLDRVKIVGSKLPKITVSIKVIIG